MRARLIIPITTVAVAILLILHFVVGTIIQRGTSSVVYEHATGKASRVVHLISEEIASLRRTVAAAAIHPINPRIPSLTEADLGILNLDMIVIIDSVGNLVWSVKSDKEASSDSFISNSLRGLSTASLLNGAISGLISIGNSPAFVTVQRATFITPDGTSSEGRLLGIRILTPQRLADISRLIGATVTIRRSIRHQQSGPLFDDRPVFNIEGSTLSGREIIGGIQPADYFEVDFSIQSPLTSADESRVVGLLTILFLSALLGVSGLSFFLFDSLLVKHIRSITQQLHFQKHNPHPTISVPPGTHNSIHDLAEKINTTLEGFALSRKAAAQATEIAHHAIYAKTEFIVSMSHEIRSPLNAILGIAQILERMSLPIHLREYVHVVKESGNTLLELITDMLDYSSIESGQITLQRSPFNIQELLTNVTHSHSEVAFKKNVEVILSIDPEAPTHIEGDRLRVKQIIDTLVENAVSCSDVGDIVIFLAPSQFLEDGRTLIRITVRDSGVGIAPERANEVFSSFNLPDPSTFLRLGRTGLSLPIIRGLARGMDGDVWVDSQYGHGATFGFEIATTAVSFLEDRNPGIEPNTDVVIVDTNPLSGEILAQVFREIGVNSIKELSTEELEELFRTLQSNVMVCIDSRLITSAIEEKLCEMASQGLVKWFALVPPHLSDSSDRFLRSGALNVIPKPISYATIFQYLGQPALREDSAPVEQSAPTRSQSSVGLSILVVDDIESNRFILATLLTGWGHKVTTASSGLEAVNLLREHGHFEGDDDSRLFDLIFMDIQMPQVNGLEATRIIRTSENLANRKKPVPIIAVTADAQVKDIDEYVTVGMWGAITKPILALRLFGVIESLGLHDGNLPARRRSTTSVTIEASGLVAALERKDLKMSVARLWSDLGHDPVRLVEILTLFVEQTAIQTEQLSHLAQTGDAAQASSLAHAIRGTLLNIGARGSAKVASQLETAAKEGAPDKIHKHARELRDSVGVLGAIITEALATHTNTSRTVSLSQDEPPSPTA